jgi:hypothetical protein
MNASSNPGTFVSTSNGRHSTMNVYNNYHQGNTNFVFGGPPVPDPGMGAKHQNSPAQAPEGLFYSRNQ